MRHHRENLRNGFYFVNKRITSTLLLWALLTSFVVPGFASEAKKPPAGMVYCPLSRQFQPVNPPRQSPKLKPFGDICSSQQIKDYLFQEIFVKNLFKRIPAGENKLDELAFDFLSHGKAALDKLPDFPDSPPENLLKKIGSSVAAGNDYKFQFVWKQPVETIALPLLPRPPPLNQTNFFTLNPVHQSDELSRRIAPRAPPVFA